VLENPICDNSVDARIWQGDAVIVLIRQYVSFVQSGVLSHHGIDVNPDTAREFWSKAHEVSSKGAFLGKGRPAARAEVQDDGTSWKAVDYAPIECHGAINGRRPPGSTSGVQFLY
jgi:hypothetical protein